VRLFLCGDVMTGRGIDQVLPHACPPHLYEPVVTSALEYVALAERENGPIPRPVDSAYIWGDALDILSDVRPHARVINLETSITTAEQAVPKGINYRMHPANVPVLRAAAIDCCVVANNHVLDWGEAGLLETIDTLAAARIPVAGAGYDLATAQAPAVLRIDDAHRVLVFACGTTDSGIPASWAATETQPGVRLLPDFSDATADRFADTVHGIKRPGDVAVASIHWGGNWGFEIPPEHRRFAHALIDRASIDVIHGHSSHHAKGIEVYRNRLILYGCGDFIDDYEGIRGHEAFRDDLVLMYFPAVDAESGELTGLEMSSLHIRNFRLNHASASDRAWLHRALDRECRRAGNGVVLRGDRLVLEWG
jgi:poly-gamma-glutamate capsule biosynthesis protein CapA/YwtB (metallophosphatase superfamily)